MDPEQEYKLLKALDEDQKLEGLVKTISKSGSSDCQVLGEAENLASKRLQYDLIDGVRLFNIDEVAAFFTGIIISRKVYG